MIVREEAKRLLILGANQLGIQLTDRQIVSFLTYLFELIRWNQKMNLTGLRQEREIIIKHFLDSLTPLTFLDPIKGERWLDIGTGAGFPCIALKIVQSDLRMTLVEAAEKKASFLHHIVGLLGLTDVTVVHDRFEYLIAPGPEERFDLMTTRALAPDLLLINGRRWVRPGGRLLFFQARPDQQIWEERLQRLSGIELERIESMTLPFSRDPRSLVLLKVV